MALPTAVTFDQVSQVIERYKDPPYYDLEDADGEFILYTSTGSCTAGAAMLASSVIVVVIVLIVIDLTGGNYYSESPAAYRAWYSWVRWLVL